MKTWDYGAVVRASGKEPGILRPTPMRPWETFFAFLGLRLSSCSLGLHLSEGQGCQFMNVWEVLWYHKGRHGSLSESDIVY